MAVGKCLNCSVEKEMKLLKKCGRCGDVLYCSRECQKVLWKTDHRYSCMTLTYFQPVREEDPGYDRQLNDNIDRWMHEWRGITERYACSVLDLANYPRRHETHAMWMELKCTGNTNPARSFKFMEGRVHTVDEILDRHPQLTNLRDPPDLVGQRVRCVLVFHSKSSRNPTFELRGMTYTDPSLLLGSDMDKRMSAKLAKKIFDVAKADFEEADPDSIRAGELRASLELLV